MTPAARGTCLWLTGTVGLLLLLGVSTAAEAQTPRQDAAEAVKEGDVAQWLKYYQRERGLQPGTPEAQPGDPNDAGHRESPDPSAVDASEARERPAAPALDPTD